MQRSLAFLFVTLSCLASCSTRQTSGDVQSLSYLKKLDPWYLSPDQVEGFKHHLANGDAYSAWMLCCYYQHQHDPKSERYLQLAADMGVPEAQCSKYAMLIQSPDRKIREGAVVWLKKAAAHGYAPAENDLKLHDEVLKLAERRHAQ